MRLSKLILNSHKNAKIFWFSLSLVFAIVYSLIALKQAFTGEFVVHDDARQHVFWMMRFVDSSLFPNDLIANYFQSVAPIGYSKLYQFAASIGINPLVFNKLLPSVLCIATTVYIFGISLEILPLPITGFITTLVLNQNLWLKDDLISATPRAFIYPFFTAFIYYLLKGSLVPCLVSLGLLGIFYPQGVLICIVLLLLRLVQWKENRIQLSTHRQDYIFSIAGLITSFLILLPFALASSEYDPTITVAEARKLPEFFPKGRSSFFRKDPINFYFFARRSGMFPDSLFTPVTLCAGLVLPLQLMLKSGFPLSQKITKHLRIILDIFFASTLMFIAAHAVLFNLHLPSRYTGHTFRIIVALATGIALTLILDLLLKWLENRLASLRVFAWSSLIAISILLVAYPSFVPHFPGTKYIVGVVPELYRFLQQQPKDIVIASLSTEASNIPTFSQRSVLVSAEYSIPYQLGYYRKMRQRMSDLIQAQYSPNLTDVKQFIQTYGISLWVLDINPFAVEYIKNKRWEIQFETGQDALKTLENGQIPALAKIRDRCQVFQTQGMVVLEAQCIASIQEF